VASGEAAHMAYGASEVGNGRKRLEKRV